MAKEIIIFDFDNTLVNSLKYWYKVMDKQLFNKLNVKIDKKMKQKRQGKSNKEIAEIFLSYSNLNMSYKEVEDLWNEYMRYYYTHKIKFLKGAKKYLYKLKQQNKKLVIASATNENLIKLALKHFDVDFFEEIYTEENIGYPKHDSDFFKECLKKLNTKPENVIFFEDSVTSIRSARKVDIDCCAIVHKLNKKHKNEFNKICKLLIKDFKSKKLNFLEI